MVNLQVFPFKVAGEGDTTHTSISEQQECLRLKERTVEGERGEGRMGRIDETQTTQS